MRLLLVLLLTGCAATTSKWAKPGASNQDFFMDDDRCQAQARPSPKGALVQPTYDACMVAKGWEKR